MQWSEVFRGARPTSVEELEKVRATCQWLRRPATSEWLHGRALSLLSHYFVAQSDEAIWRAMASDWHDELKTFPAWAVQNAAKWWLSADNPKRRTKPTPGDISERARFELGFVQLGEVMIAQGVKEPEAPPLPPVPEKTAEERREFAESLLRGFAGRQKEITKSERPDQ